MTGIGIEAVVTRARGTKAERVTSQDQSGSVSVETLVTLPALMLLTVLVVAVGWLVTGQNAVRSAASEAVRVASLSRSADGAAEAARAAANTTLDNSDLKCRTTSVRVDTSGFAVPVGQDATVDVTVTCEVALSEYGLPGLGDRTVTATATSALDTYRER